MNDIDIDFEGCITAVDLHFLLTYAETEERGPLFVLSAEHNGHTKTFVLREVDGDKLPEALAGAVRCEVGTAGN